ncbi:hypothetical protein C8R44DRAFT_856875 [Mycena epipterygia]|nr:hypothetical protein C8R44DRAFT_856875 [Mycena epipterygia]
MTFQQAHSPPTPSAPAVYDGFNGQGTQYIGEDGLYILHSAIAIGASYDSIERYPPPRCHPQTRKVVFEIILAWLNNSLHGPRVLWVHGPAGSGKSAISQTVAEYCAQSGQLGATFFFSHGKGDLSDGGLLFPTIAYKLAGAIPAMRAPLSRAIQANTGILTQSLEVQAQKLIVEPLSTISRSQIPTLIVIDSLDACDGDDTQNRILALLGHLIVVHRLPLCFFLTSRGYPHIQATFDSPVFRKLSNRIPLDVFTSDSDVRNFLRSEFASVRHAHHHAMAGIPDPWPSEDVVELLVRRSGGNFMYPATVLRYVDDASARPAERLVEVVVAAASTESSAHSPTDELYDHILTSSPRAAPLRVLGPLTALYAPLPPRELGLLLGADADELHGEPTVLAATAPLMRLAHPSVREFLLDPRRARRFWVDPRAAHAEVAHGCIRYICEYMDGTEGLDLASYQYIRRKWVRHLAHAEPSASLLDALRERRFVYSRVPPEVRAVLEWLQSIPEAPRDVVQLWRGWEAELRMAA